MQERKSANLEATQSVSVQLHSPQPIWIIGDIVVTLVAFLLAIGLRFRGDYSEAIVSVGDLTSRAFLFAVLVMIGLFVTGMYRTRQRVLPVQILTRVSVSVAIGGFLNILVYYLYPPLLTGRGVLIVALFLAFLGITLTRRLTSPFSDRYIRRRQIVVVGRGRAAQKVAMRRRRADLRCYEVVAYLETSGDLPVVDGIDLGRKLDNIEDLYSLDIDEVVLALDERRGTIDSEVLLNLRQIGTNVISLVDFLEREAGRVDIDVADSAWFIFTQGCHARPSYLSVKRVVDICGSIGFLILLAPVLTLVALALSIEGRFKLPVFYRQSRVGLRGEIFDVLKFRSMSVDAEEDGPQWSSQSDNRVTRVGRVIRRLRLDELPQLLNILKGEMSIVGPRPERPEFVKELSQIIPMYEYRHLVKPGLAGWAQLSFPYGESASDAREKLKFDLYYIKNASLILDLFILAQTFEIVVWGEGLSMAGRNHDFGPNLPSAKLPFWRPRQHDTYL